MFENKLWVEKYRPKRFEDVVGNRNIIEQISKIERVEDMPHLLFGGPAGVGKTTCALILANKFFGEDINMNFLELNASDERGIEVVRNNIKDFAKTMGLSTSKKIIFLDEFDSMTQDAQTALRRTMEQYSNNCVFILACNYLNKVIEPIKSRCSVYEFTSIKKEDVKLRIKKIIEVENVKIKEDMLNVLIDNNYGDLRKILNNLQSLSMLGREIKQEDIHKLSVNYKEFFLSDYKSRRKFIYNLLNEGVNERQILREIRDWIVENDDVTDAKTVGVILYELMMTDYRIIVGVDKYLAIDGLLVRL